MFIEAPYKVSIYNGHTMMGLLEISTENYAQGPISQQTASMTLIGEIVYYFYSLGLCFAQIKQCQNHYR